MIRFGLLSMKPKRLRMSTNLRPFLFRNLSTSSVRDEIIC